MRIEPSRRRLLRSKVAWLVTSLVALVGVAGAAAASHGAGAGTGSSRIRVTSCPPRLASYAPPGSLTEAGIWSSTVKRFPTVGRLRALMLFADFPDAPGDGSPAAYFDRVAGTIPGWIKEASYGRLSFDLSFVDKWFRLPQPTSSYDLRLYVDAPLRLPLIHDAVVAADPDVDFSAYPIVFIVLPERANLGSSPTVGIFPETGIRPDGNDRFNVAVLGNDTRWTGSSELTATTLSLAGLPWLNVQDRYGPNPVGPWDVMSLEPPGSGPLAWHRWLAGWLDRNQFVCLPRSGSITTTLTPLARSGGLKAVVISTGASAVDVAEVREPVGTDAGLCDRGVLVYSVDARRLPFSGPIRILSAHRGQPPPDSVGARQCGPLYNAPYDVGLGELPRFRDPYHRITITVLAATARGYTVRVTRAGVRHQ